MTIYQHPVISFRQGGPIQPKTSSEIETRVLDAVAALIAYYGYDKTTVDDIAREAGVAKSTLYSRWKTKDVLFNALVWRETRRFAEDWFERVEADPDGGTFAGIFRHALLALRDNAFVMALYSDNRRVLGTLLAKPEMQDAYAQRIQMSQTLLSLLQAAGTVRQDIDVNAVAYVGAALQYGLLKLGDAIPDDLAPPADDALDVAVDMMRCYLEPPGGGDSAAGKAVIRQMMAQMRARLDEFEGRDMS